MFISPAGITGASVLLELFQDETKKVAVSEKCQPFASKRLKGESEKIKDAWPEKWAGLLCTHQASGNR